MPHCLGVQGQAWRGSLTLLPSFQKTQTKQSTSFLLKNTVSTSHTERSPSKAGNSCCLSPGETPSVDVAATDRLAIQGASRGSLSKGDMLTCSQNVHCMCSTTLFIHTQIHSYVCTRGPDQQEHGCAGWRCVLPLLPLRLNHRPTVLFGFLSVLICLKH